MVGKQVVQQGLALNHTIKAFGRNVDNLIDKDLHDTKFEAIKGYVFDEDEVYNAIQNSDAVISVLGGGFDGLDKTRSLGIKNIVTQMQKVGVHRIIALGGLGILNVTDDELLIESPTYPLEYIPVGLEHLAAYNFLATSKLDYTFVCAPNILNANKTERYITSANYPPVPNNNEIAAGDIAHFMLQELVNNYYCLKKVGISRL